MSVSSWRSPGTHVPKSRRHHFIFWYECTPLIVPVQPYVPVLRPPSKISLWPVWRVSNSTGGLGQYTVKREGESLHGRTFSHVSGGEPHLTYLHCLWICEQSNLCQSIPSKLPPNCFLWACVLSYFSRVWLFATLWIVGHQAPLFMGSSRQEYWSGLLCPPRGDLLTASLMSPALADGFFTPSTTWEAQLFLTSSQNTVLC